MVYFLLFLWGGVGWRWGFKLDSLINGNIFFAQSATVNDSLVAAFCYKPLDSNIDWSLAAKASPCYVTVS